MQIIFLDTYCSRVLSSKFTERKSHARVVDSQGAAGTLLKPPLTPPDGQAGVFAAQRAVPPRSPLLAHTGGLGAEAAVAGDLELLRLLQDPAGRLTVVRAGRRRSNPLLRRSGRPRCCHRCGARVLAHRPQPQTSSPWKPLAADGVRLRQSCGVALAPRSARLPPPRLSVRLPC